MIVSSTRVLILDVELNRIREYVTSVPHRVTGGLLLGQRYQRGDVSVVVISRTTMRIPDERLPDERSCTNHPVFTIADVGKALEKIDDAIFLGRWHTHLDGFNRPTMADYEWAREFLGTQGYDRESLPYILHPIVTFVDGEVIFTPFLATADSGSFQKVAWQHATAAEIERVKRDRPAPVSRAKEADVGMFSLNKTRQLFREEAINVAALPHVLNAEVRDDGSVAILEVGLTFGDKRGLLHITGDPWYPVHPPGLRLLVDERPFKVLSPVLEQWTSMCTLRDLVKDVAENVDQQMSGHTLAPPEVDESDPIKREIAILQAANYRVYRTPADQTGSLITVRSTLLDNAAKIFYAILPPNHPLGSVAWAIADEGVQLSEVQFETLEELPAGFTLLTWFERLVPAAREERAGAVVARRRRPFSMLLLVLYTLLFVASGAVGYLFQTADEKDVNSLWAQTVYAVKDRFGLLPHAAPSQRPAPAPVVLNSTTPVLAVVMDAGMGTNLNTPEAMQAVSTSLRPLPCDVIQVDLRNTAHDLIRVVRAAHEVQALIVFTYGAGDKQSDFVKSLVAQVHRPVGVISMAPGSEEDALAEMSAFYQAVTGSGVAAAQRAFGELKRGGQLLVK